MALEVKKNIFEKLELVNWPYLKTYKNGQLTNIELTLCSKTELDRLADKQPFSLVLHEFSFAKFSRLDAVNRMCQWPNFESLDLSNYTEWLVLYSQPKL